MDREFYNELCNHVEDSILNGFSSIDGGVSISDKHQGCFIYLLGEALTRYSDLTEADVVYNYISFLLDGNEIENEDTGEAVFTSPDFPKNAADEWDDYEDLYGTLETIIEDIVSYDSPTGLIKKLVLEMGIDDILEDVNSIYFDRNRRDHFIVMY